MTWPRRQPSGETAPHSELIEAAGAGRSADRVQFRHRFRLLRCSERRQLSGGDGSPVRGRRESSADRENRPRGWLPVTGGHCRAWSPLPGPGVGCPTSGKPSPVSGDAESRVADGPPRVSVDPAQSSSAVRTSPPAVSASPRIAVPACPCGGSCSPRHEKNSAGRSSTADVRNLKTGRSSRHDWVRRPRDGS